LVDVLSPDDLILEAQSAEEFHLLQEYLGVLPEGERLAIHAFFFDEQTALQAAEQMDLSRSGFYAILNRAVARLEKMFSSLDSGKESP
jgi:RNA polymerase sigma-70 factor (ECF subfamily)